MISIIVPVYNVYNYLEQCLKSIAQQSYASFECILVDDGSSDGSERICDDWVQKDSRFHVIHQQNQGVSAARNQGIVHSKGEYVTFIDSDDWVDIDYLSQLTVHSYTLDGSCADLVVSGLIYEYLLSHSQEIVTPSKTFLFNLVKEYVTDFVDLNKKNLLYGPCLKLYRKDILVKNNIFFDKSYSYGEDLLFNYQYLQHVHTISCVSEAHYHYRIIGHGTLSTKIREDMFFINYKQWHVLENFYKDKHLWTKEAESYLYGRLWGIIYDAIFQYPLLPNRKYSYLSEILQISEISDLTRYTSLFTCKDWIKRLILQRKAWAFYVLFKLKK